MGRRRHSNIGAPRDLGDSFRYRLHPCREHNRYEPRALDQVSAIEPARLQQQAIRPFEPGVRDPARRPAEPPREKVEPRSDGERHRRPHRILISVDPELLFRGAEPDENDVWPGGVRARDRLSARTAPSFSRQSSQPTMETPNSSTRRFAAASAAPGPPPSRYTRHRRFAASFISGIRMSEPATRSGNRHPRSRLTHTSGMPSASDRLTSSYALRKAPFDSALTT